MNQTHLNLFAPPPAAGSATLALRDRSRAAVHASAIADGPPATFFRDNSPDAMAAGVGFLSQSVRAHLENARRFCDAELPVEAANEIDRATAAFDAFQDRCNASETPTQQPAIDI